MTTDSWFEASIEEIVDGYVEGFNSKHLNDDKLVDEICDKLNEIINAERIKEIVTNRLDEIRSKQTTSSADSKHIHFTYTCETTDKYLFKEVKEKENGFEIVWMDELENDELKICEEIFKQVEFNKLDKYDNISSVHISFGNNNSEYEFILSLFINQLMNRITSYDFIVKLIDEENGIYDIEEFFD